MNFSQQSKFLILSGIFIILESTLTPPAWGQKPNQQKQIHRNKSAAKSNLGVPNDSQTELDTDSGAAIEEPPLVHDKTLQPATAADDQAECDRSVHDYLQYVKKASQCGLHKDKKLACTLPNGRVVVHPNIKNRFVVTKSKNLKNDIIKYYQKEYCKKWQSIDVEAMLELK